MRNDVGVANIHGAVRQDRAEERAYDALCLVRTPHEAIADVEDHQRVHLRRQRSRRR